MSVATDLASAPAPLDLAPERQAPGCRCLPPVDLQRLALPAAVVDEAGTVRACNPAFATLIGCGTRPPGACSDHQLAALLPALAGQLPGLAHASAEAAAAFGAREVLLTPGEEPRNFAAYLSPLDPPAVSAPGAAEAWRAPWMLVLADVTPLRADDRTKRENLALEVVLSRIATRLIANEDPRSAFEASLADLGHYTEADGSFLGIMAHDSEDLEEIHVWRRDGEPSPLLALRGGTLPAWWRRMLDVKESFDVTDLQDLPAEAMQELVALGVETTGSIRVVPLEVADRLAGLLAVYHAEPRSEASPRCCVVLETFRHLLERLVHSRWKDAALQRSTQDLQEKQIQLVQSEKMATIGQMAAGVAHEINNPVGFIMGNLSTLQSYAGSLKTLLDLGCALDAAATDLPAELRQRLQDLDHKELAFIAEDLDNLLAESLEGCVRVRDIVQNLKGFARADEKTPQPVDLNTCVESTLKMVWNELKYRCDVVTELGELPPVVCRVGQINQVVMNLLINAAHAIADRGTVTVATRSEGESVVLTVADTGSGIPPENVPRLFDPFFTTKPAGKGTGLGLNICRNIVEQHHGTIEVASEVGVGTTFTVRLPVGEAPDGGEDLIG